MRGNHDVCYDVCVMMSVQSDTLLYERVSGSRMEMFDFEYVRSEGWDCLYPVEEHPAFD